MFRSHSLEFLRERLWFALISVSLLTLLILYTTTGGLAFFILGPAVLFFSALTQFPRIYIWLNKLEAEHGPQYLRLRQIAQKINTQDKELPVLYISSDVEVKSNFILLASGKTQWLIAHPSFVELFNDDQLLEILETAQELFFHTVTQRATLLSALQYFLFFLPWSHHRGNELAFYSLREDHKWSRLLFERTLNPPTETRPPRYLAPSSLFPVLSNYNKKSYYSLYVYLRNQWIEQSKSDLYKITEEQ
jgi:hypothetical protein